ncbi:hypothetical protein NP233_g284 [Leucocoprinus birnbaumii]|uniref:GH16 domain-containing protein n=1 Tax=Leucocoprinus birnbaumii TaxID=56174 RepID=A0AAD5YWU4_9AGAR|nr:hypothetical protein NP233_g284 [Leucocoprinus birnbaumii]
MPRPLACLLLALGAHFAACSAFSWPAWSIRSREGRRLPGAKLEKRQRSINRNRDGTPFVWLPVDEYSGDQFFELSVGFLHGTRSNKWSGEVRLSYSNGCSESSLLLAPASSYVPRDEAFSKRLVYTLEDGTAIIRGDNDTWLDQGVKRDSVRISTQTRYNTGLFILDLRKAPWGCGTWPAFWTLGEGTWPYAGEIDIIEGVHDNQHNQVAWHTSPGCHLATNSTFTGTIVNVDGQNHTDCNGLINNNAGCGVVDWSRASYGPYFDSQGGGVFVMKWDENGIAVWSFYRQAIPKDIIDGVPHSDGWGPPSAFLDPSQCDPLAFFKNHTIILNITFCGDWAGNSYATSGCPGTCAERLQDPSNFVNATWVINSLKVYEKQDLHGLVSSAVQEIPGFWTFWATLAAAAITFLL